MRPVTTAPAFLRVALKFTRKLAAPERVEQNLLSSTTAKVKPGHVIMLISCNRWDIPRTERGAKALIRLLPKSSPACHRERQQTRFPTKAGESHAKTCTNAVRMAISFSRAAAQRQKQIATFEQRIKSTHQPRRSAHKRQTHLAHDLSSRGMTLKPKRG